MRAKKPTNSKNDKIQIGALNCQGIKDKIDTPEVLNLIERTEIFGVSETWLSTNNNINLPGYTFYPFNRKNIKGAPRGGVGIFIKDAIKKNVKIRYDLSCENYIWCKVTKEYLGYGDDLYLGFVYFPPEDSPREKKVDRDQFKHLLETVAKIKSEEVILMGDFNARTKNMDDTLTEEKHEDIPIQDFFSNIKSKRSNQDPKVNNYGNKLIEYCIGTLSYIANGRTLGDFEGKLTCHQPNGSSTVDYAVIKEKLKTHVRRFQVMDPSTGSDHCPIILELRTDTSKRIDKKTIFERPPPIMWNETNKLKFIKKMGTKVTNDKIVEIRKMISDESNNIDAILHEINNLYDISEKPKQNDKNRNTKKKKSKNKMKKWYDASCSELSIRLRRTAKLLATSPNNPHIRANFIKSKKTYKKLLKDKKREWKNRMVQKLEMLENKDPKEYWKLVNDLREKRRNNTQYDAEKFTLFFEQLYSETEVEKNEKMKTQIDEMLDQLTNMSDEPDFTLEELINAIKALKNNKAAGPDRIPAEMLKASNAKLLKLLLNLLNKIKTICKCPKTWAIGITSLLLKEGDDDDPNNYRPITVTDALSKVLAILINERLDKWSTSNNIQRKAQIGFKKKSRPSDHLLVLKTLVCHYNNNGKKLYTCFVDFKKAFDSVWRLGMIYKLIKCGMNTSYIKLIRHMYEQTSQSLKINNGLSRPFMTSKGVKQGCILSPRLFNLFINDLPLIFDTTCDPVQLGNAKLSCLMYADDLILLSETAEGIQNFSIN